MTRDEHIARAEELLTGAEKILLQVTVSGGESNASELIAAAQVHATLAVALGQQNPEATPAGPVTPRTFTYSNTVYALDAMYVDADGDRWLFHGELNCGMPLMRQVGHKLDADTARSALPIVVYKYGPLARYSGER